MWRLRAGPEFHEDYARLSPREQEEVRRIAENLQRWPYDRPRYGFLRDAWWYAAMGIGVYIVFRAVAGASADVSASAAVAGPALIRGVVYLLRIYRWEPDYNDLGEPRRRGDRWPEEE